MSIRTKKDKVINRRGIEVYNFDSEKEISKYRFLCNAKMKKKQKKSLKEEDEFYTYADWELHIKKKYLVYSAVCLNEFSKYLNHRIRMTEQENEGLNMYVSAMISTSISILITSAAGIKLAELDYVSYFFAITFIAIIILGAGAILLINAIDIFRNNAIDYHFYQDYKDIIDKIIEEKQM